MSIPMIPRSVSSVFRSTLYLALVLSGLWLTGCESDDPVLPYPRTVLDQMPPGEDLAAAIDAGWQALAEQTAPVGEQLDLSTYCRLVSAGMGSAARDSALVEIAALWRAEPSHLLWLELAAVRFRSLNRGLIDSLYADPALTAEDTSHGRFARAMATGDRGERADLLAAALDTATDLTPFERAWLNYQLVFYRDNRRPAPEAIARWMELLPQARQDGGPLLEMLIWYRIGRLSVKRDRISDALHAYLLTANLARRHGADYYLCISLNRAANRLIKLRENRGTGLLLADAIEVAERNGYDDYIPGLKTNAAGVHADLGETEEALDLVGQVLDEAVAQRDSLWVVKSLANKAQYYQITSELDSCRCSYDRALRWSDCLVDPLERVKLDFCRSEYFLHIGDYAAVDSLLAVADSVLTAVGPTRSAGEPTAPPAESPQWINRRAEYLVRTIRLARLSGRPAAAYIAIEELRRLKAGITDSSVDYSLVGDAERTIAEFLGWQGEHALARRALDEARQVVVSRGGEYDLWWLEKTAFELAMWCDDLRAAETAAERCLDIAHRRENIDLTSVSRSLLGRLHLARGDLDEAVRLFTIPRDENFRRHEFRTVLSNLIFKGIALSRQHDHDAALASFRAAVALHDQDPPADLQAWLQLGSARVLRQGGDFAAAGTALQEALTNLNAARYHPNIEALHLFYFDLAREIVEELIDLRLTAHPTDNAASPALATLLLAEGSRHLGGDDSESSAAERLAEVAHPGSPALVFFVGRERSFRWTLSVDGVTVDRLPGREDLKDQLAAVLTDFRSPSHPVDETALRKLSRLLLGSIADTWHTDHVLRVVPDDLLASVPWYGLQIETREGVVRSLVHHGEVIESRQLGRSGPVGEGKHRRTRAIGAGAEMLAIGVNSRSDPTAGAETQLRFAEQEAQEVADLWRPDPTTLALGADASWSHLQHLELRRFAAIHLATHTDIYQGRTGQSVIRLGTGAEATPLSLKQIGDLDLSADLVFISCCEAARRVTRSGATTDFAQAFLVAGAKAVVAPSIRIEDQAARDLARSFYRCWRSGGTRSAALREALADMAGIDSPWQHPHYWAFYRLLE